MSIEDGRVRLRIANLLNRPLHLDKAPLRLWIRIGECRTAGEDRCVKLLERSALSVPPHGGKG